MLQLLLPERATEERVAVLVNAIGEVLTCHADADSIPVLKLCVVDQAPFLHCQYQPPVSTGVLSVLNRRAQDRFASPIAISILGRDSCRLAPIWSRKRSKPAQISSKLLKSQSMPMLGLSTIDELSCVTITSAVTQYYLP